MKGLSYAAFAALTLLALPAHSAEITRTISGFEPDMTFPFGVDLQVSYDRYQHRALINRENHQSGDIIDVAELRITDIKQELPIRLAIGLYHDLELHATLPIILSWNRSYGYPSITGASNSSVANNCVTARGGYDCSVANNFADRPGGYYDPNKQVSRHGVGDITVGVAWGVLSEKRDDTKPTWVLGFDYTYPLATVIDPSVPSSDTNATNVGSKVQLFEPYMAMSKRVGYVDPYIKISATIPHLLGGFHSNCDDDPTKIVAFPENCPGGGDANSTWTRQDTGEKPPYLGTVVFGAELYAYDAPEKNQALTIDLRGTGQFVSEGRYYNEMSDQLGKLLFTEQYLHMGATFGINFRGAKYVELRLAASYWHDTDHFLTNENVGEDATGCSAANCNNGRVDLPPTPNAPDTTGEINPNYDFRYDGVGRRFRIGQVNDFEFSATGVLTF